MFPKDFLGQDINAGDTIVYATSRGHVTFLRRGVVKTLVTLSTDDGKLDTSLRVEILVDTYIRGGDPIFQQRPKIVTLRKFEAIVVLRP